MINQTTKDRIESLCNQYINLAKANEIFLKEIALAEIPVMVYNSNAIENSTLSLEDTEKILSGGSLERKVTIREVYEAKNLAKTYRNGIRKKRIKTQHQTHFKFTQNLTDRH